MGAAETMRVLHLLKTSHGAEWAYRQMRELVKLGVEVHVAMPAGGPLIPRYEQAGIVVHLVQLNFPVNRPWQCQSVFRSVRSLVDEVKPDLIHSHFVGTTLSLRFALGKHHSIPRIFQVPGPLHLEHWMFRWFELSSAGASDFWVGSSNCICELYRKAGVSKNRIFLSYYCPELSKVVSKPTGKLRTELALRPEAKIVGMVAFMYSPKWYLGQFRGLKGHEDLIDAIAIISRKRLDIVCLIIGSGSFDGATAYERRLWAFAKRRCPGRIVFLGWRTDVQEIYPDFDVVVHPSHSENLGGSGESLLAAVPTIATNVGGFPDLVKPGQTGWLVRPGNPMEIAKAIEQALDNPEQSRRMALEGQALACSLVDVKRNTTEILKIYNEILHDNRVMGVSNAI